MRLEGKTKTTTFSYNNHNKRTSLGSDYDNISLDKKVLPLLSMFGTGATLGSTSANMEIDAQQFEFIAGYGLSDNLTVGIIVPFRKYQRVFNFSVANGNIGINPTFDNTMPMSPTNLPYLPTSIAGITPMTTADVQTLLASEALDLGYKPLESTNNSGFADPTLGVLWSTYNNDTASLILGAGYRFGIAKENDPNHLLHTDIGDGNSGIRLQVEYFRDLTQGFDLYSKIEYGIELADSITSRVPKDGEFLAPKSSTEQLKRDLGDYRVYDIAIGKAWNNYRISTAWHRADKDTDQYSSAKGTNTSALEAHTYSYANQWEASLSWSGVEAWKKGELPFPLIVDLSYRDTYKAKNALDWQEISLQLTSFF